MSPRILSLHNFPGKEANKETADIIIEPLSRRARLVNDERQSLLLSEATLPFDRVPTPEERVSKAQNLQRLESARTRAVQPSFVSLSSIPARIEDFIDRKRLWNVKAWYFSSGDAIEIFSHKAGEEREGHIKKRRFSFKDIDSAERDACMDVFILFLEYLPCELKELSQHCTRWLVTMARMTASAIYPHLLPVLDLPILTLPATLHSSSIYDITLHGIESRTKGKEEAWSLTVSVTVGSVFGHVAITVPPEYEWSEDQQEPHGKLEESKLDPQELHCALQLSKLISSRFQGFMGSKKECEAAVRRFQQRYRQFDRSDLDHGPFFGHPLWSAPRQWKSGTRFWIAPSHALRQAIEEELRSIYLETRDGRRWQGVMNTMLNTLAAVGDVLEVWKAGSTAADEINAAIDEGLPPDFFAPLSCPERKGHWHACAECCSARLCIDFSTIAKIEYPICGACKASFDDKSKRPAIPPTGLTASMKRKFSGERGSSSKRQEVQPASFTHTPSAEWPQSIQPPPSGVDLNQEGSIDEHLSASYGNTTTPKEGVIAMIDGVMYTMNGFASAEARENAEKMFAVMVDTCKSTEDLLDFIDMVNRRSSAAIRERFNAE